MDTWIRTIYDNDILFPFFIEHRNVDFLIISPNGFYVNINDNYSKW